MFEYAAKPVCGLHRDPRDRRLMRGAYATTINIHNPNDIEAGRVIDSIGEGPHALAPDQALSVDCMDIQRQLGRLPAAYIEGFVVIQSRESLDVSAVYTSAAVVSQGQLMGHIGIDVEQIRERQKEG